MRRRTFLGFAGAAAVFPRVALGQAKVPRIAILATPLTQTSYDWIDQGLASQGYVTGNNIIVERFIAPTTDDLMTLASQAVASRPDIILSATTPATQAAMSATKTIPIVMLANNDPVGNGLVSSLARPGGNVTGATGTAPDIAGKQLAVLKELSPAINRLAVLSLPADPSTPAIVTQIQSAARPLTIEPVIVGFDQSRDFDEQLARVAQTGAQAFFDLQIGYFTTRQQQLLDLAVANKLVWMTSDPTRTPFLAVVAYGPDRRELYRQSAGSYVAAILKGTKPADLPVQEPKTFDLALNLITAKALGITIPPSILAQATIVNQSRLQRGTMRIRRREFLGGLGGAAAVALTPT